MSKDSIYVACSDDKTIHSQMLLKYTNRHGLITGATGTGKTVTLQSLAEGFSKAGVPVFMADVKGDLQSIHQSGQDGKHAGAFQKRIDTLGIEGFNFTGYPVKYWDCYGEAGIPIRTTISEIGALLLSRILELNDVQEGILNIVFHIADKEGLHLIDLKDLRSMLVYVADHAAEISKEYGNISKNSIAAIQRSLLVLETQGGDKFFGETALFLEDIMRTTYDGKGFINILSAVKLVNSPDLYSAFLLWLLSELYENLPEMGDSDKPKLVFFFDEAHLLFNNAPKSLLDKVEQVTRLIRSKGVGIFFVTQNPIDIPDDILGQLANRVQHALRAYSPKDQKAVKVAAETFRTNPNMDTQTVITQLGIGEALVSFPDQKGIPQMVERVKIIPPEGKIGACSPAQHQTYIQKDDLYPKYIKPVDPHSAYEMLEERLKVEAEKKEAEAAGSSSFFGSLFGGGNKSTTGKKTRSRQSIGETVMKSVARNVAGQVGRQIGRAIIRGVLGSLIK